MRIKTGIVVSNKMEKTLVVAVESYKTHPKYKKKYRVTNKFHVHSEDSTIQMGDNVRFQESKPLSKTKKWILIEKL
jgi:small subunit ribosomal protein S17